MLQYFDTLTAISGAALFGATLQVKTIGGALAPIYSTDSTSSPIANSTVTSDITGQVNFFIPDGIYTFLYSFQGTLYKTRSPIQIGVSLTEQSAAEAAVSVTPTNLFYPVLDVRRYGADLTGVNPSTTAIQNALNVANQLGGGKVVMPAGQYTITATLTRPANVYIVGDGPEATAINPTGNFAAISAIGTSSNVLNRGGVQNLVINGQWGANHANTAAIGISESWTNRAIHRDVRFHGCYQGFYGNQGLWQVVWDNLQADGQGTQQNNYGFYLDQLPTSLPSGTSNAVKAINTVAQNTNTAGFKALNPNGSFWVNCEAMNGVTGFDMGNTGTNVYPCEFFHAANCTADTNSANGWQFQQGSNASPCTFIQLANCWGSTHGQYGLYLNGCTYINVSNFQSGNNSQGAVLLNSAQYCTIISGTFQLNNTGNNSGIGDVWIAGGSYNRIEACLSNMANSTSKSVLESAATNANTIINNTLFQGATIIGANTVTRNNQGYRTETVGTATILAANTSVTVTHGLAVTPNLDAIMATPTTAWGTAASWWLSNVTSTTFQINCNAAPGGSGLGFNWQINLNTVY